MAFNLSSAGYQDVFSSQIHTRLGTALQFLKQYEEAIKAYESGLKIQPDNQQMKDGIQSCKKAQSQLNNPFADPNLLAKLAMNPKTREYCSDPSYIQLIN